MPEENLQHRTVRMSGRDPNEGHRAATPLELLFDLAFVVAFGTAAYEFAHALSADHVVDGIIAFCFVTFGISWAWINFTWFASAYDTDDWLYRLLTMLQMVGVLIFALGLHDVFKSLDEGEILDNDILVWGYVVMRVALVLQWWRANRQDPDRRQVHRVYIMSLLAAQVVWVAIALIDLSIPVTFAVMLVPFAIELGGPAIAERRTEGTPWHAHHIAERYGLMVIIALGEGLIGTMTTLTAIEDLTLDVALLAFAGTAVTFGMWWSYFSIPHGRILDARRDRSFGWGYGHIVIFGAIVAIGAGLHAAAYLLEHHSKLSVTATVLTVAVPVLIYMVALYLLYSVFSRSFDPFHLLLIALTLVAVIVPVVLASVGVGLVGCLLALSAAPWVTVLGYELHGHRHVGRILDGLQG